MTETENSLQNDIEKIRQIPIVNSMLEVICRSTGMGFAAIARVTSDRWIACSVRDEIAFGLEPGQELKIDTTICNEIRDSLQPVIIENVAEDPFYCSHHTPRIYGLQSYISMPIILKNGDFFGTLCAIDPKPAKIGNTQTIEMFRLFADLLSFHLQSLDIIERSNSAFLGLNKKLTDSIDENRQYQYISHHNLQEPLRKIRVFSSMLIEETKEKNSKIRELALKLDANAKQFSMMIKDLSDYSDLNRKAAFEPIDLNLVVGNICTQLAPTLEALGAAINIPTMPEIQGIPFQIEHLFYHLIHNALRFSKSAEKPVVNIEFQIMGADQASNPLLAENTGDLIEISVADNGIGIEQSQLENIFDIFSKLSNDSDVRGEGIGLAYCRKIIRNHGGSIQVQSEIGKGSVFIVRLPI